MPRLFETLLRPGPAGPCETPRTRGDLPGRARPPRMIDLATATLGISKRTAITNKQFQEVDPANSETVTCRALDKFTEKLPGLLRWRKSRQMLLFGGPNLRDALEKNKVVFIEKLMPMSEQRYLFVLNR